MQTENPYEPPQSDSSPIGKRLSTSEVIRGILVVLVCGGLVVLSIYISRLVWSMWNGQ